MLLSKAEIKGIIESAFDGVALDGGISLEQATAIDNYREGVTPTQFDALPKNEITDDWRAIPTSQLDEAENIAHLDAKGFRYYVPALMLRLLDNYDPRSMMTICTLSSLYPKPENREGREYQYSLLADDQRRAIAFFIEALPTLVEMWGEDKTVVERAYRNYWFRYAQGE